jgi:opacity protein-like surface antigen
MPAQSQSSGGPQPTAAEAEAGGWHFDINPYLWFAGVHGTVGALGQEASVHAGAGDVLSKFNIGLMGEFEPRYKRLLLPLDLMWVKLSDDSALPLEQGPDSVKVKLTQTILTPGAAYRLVDKKIKVDGMVAIRYWHLGQNYTFEPAGPLGGISQSANWVDVVSGARIQLPLSARTLVTIFGDAGGGGANLDYQAGGLLGFKIKPNMTLQAGWRYLDVNYRPNRRFLYDVAQTGLLLGTTITLK